MNPDELAGAVDTLTAAVRELSDRVDTQRKMIEAIKKHTRDIHSTWIVLAVVLALAVACGFLGYQVESNQRQLQQVQARTSVEVLCPLYVWLAQSLRLNPAPAAATPEQVQLRKSAADTITRGLTTLGCAP
ncbi:hypothetical protein [Nocardia spumae]|uniref:hypothetical protein n=1 Tax=Nocardia spumae TaxID=2887190 RepID=UPI001D138363|nr:hypothetical protein [Nocardia spumae]